jgi:hypothetical protein
MLLPDIEKLTLSYQKKKSLFGVVLVLPSLLLLFTSSTFAARPLTTEDTGTVEKGAFQLETGFDFARQENYDKEFASSMTLTYGLLSRMDMGIASGYLFVDPAEGKKENGFADTEVKVKYRLMDEKGRLPSFAVMGKVKIPTASESKGLGSGKTDFSIITIFQKNLSKRLTLYLNLGYTFIGEHRANDEFNYSLAGQFVLSDKWALVGEIVGVNNFNGRKGDDPLSGLLGIQYLITEGIVWDAGVGIGMSKAAPDYRITTGFTLLFKP